MLNHNMIEAFPPTSTYSAIKWFRLLHLEKSLARSMLFYSRNCWQQTWVHFVLYINSDCMYIGDLWLQLWLKNHCENTGYYFIFQLALLLLLNNYQYNCNNTISSMSVLIYHNKMVEYYNFLFGEKYTENMS